MSGTITVVSQCVLSVCIYADHHVPVVVCVCRPSDAWLCLCVCVCVCADHHVPVVCVCRPSGACCFVFVCRPSGACCLCRPLSACCCCLCVQTIRCLLSLGADVNARDKNERTALQLAVAVNRPRVARCLIDAGGQLL